MLSMKQPFLEMYSTADVWKSLLLIIGCLIWRIKIYKAYSTLYESCNFKRMIMEVPSSIFKIIVALKL